MDVRTFGLQWTRYGIPSQPSVSAYVKDLQVTICHCKETEFRTYISIFGPTEEIYPKILPFFFSRCSF